MRAEEDLRVGASPPRTMDQGPRTPSELTHFDESGASRMVDVSSKAVTLRMARASGQVRMEPATLALVKDRGLAKGDVLEVARLAGIMAAKRTGDLIPLCHPLGLDSVEVNLEPIEPDTIRIEACVKMHGRTGVEMEALTAVSVAALTVYDMCKAVDRGLVIARIQLEEKSGGRRGTYRRADEPAPPGPTGRPGPDPDAGRESARP
jgi:cyclic pyranopterin phosphate synthase